MLTKAPMQRHPARDPAPTSRKHAHHAPGVLPEREARRGPRFVYSLGAVLSGYFEGKPTYTSKLAFYLEIDRKTMERRLQTLIRMRLVRREGRSYLPTETTLGTFDHVPRLARRIWGAAETLAAADKDRS